VEDHPVNQRLALRILEKWGHSIRVAANGRSAIEAFKSEEFKLILMDVQMPEVGGMEATAAIREIEKERESRVPIIAMTAHAISGYREKCLEAGMNDYISKPIDPERLFALMEQWLRPQLAGVGIAASESISPLNTKSALSRAGGDLELFRELASVFLSDTPALLQSIENAVAASDWDRLERDAHRLKGAVGNFDAAPLAELASRLETVARLRQSNSTGNLCAEINREFTRLTHALDGFLKEAA
jgi:CheY-like chemotaxis protein